MDLKMVAIYENVYDVLKKFIIYLKNQRVLINVHHEIKHYNIVQKMFNAYFKKCLSWYFKMLRSCFYLLVHKKYL